MQLQCRRLRIKLINSNQTFVAIENQSLLNMGMSTRLEQKISIIKLYTLEYFLLETISRNQILIYDFLSGVNFNILSHIHIYHYGIDEFSDQNKKLSFFQKHEILIKEIKSVALIS